MQIRKYIPNTITCLNLATGCVAVIVALQANYTMAMLCILLSAVFDFLDGLAARMLHAYSPMGKELDSLADMVSFGVVPAAMVFSLYEEITYTGGLSSIEEYIPYFGFLIAIFSALRLAKFNIDTRQTTSFIGMPVPANALFWGALTMTYHELFATNEYGIWVLTLLVVVFSYLLVSEIPMFSLKFKNLKWNDNKVSFSFLLVCIPLIIFFHEGAPAFIIVWYILLSAFTQRKQVA